jgi:hypothetical protein
MYLEHSRKIQDNCKKSEQNTDSIQYQLLDSGTCLPDVFGRQAKTT